MSENRAGERPGHEAAKLWMEQRKQKPNTSVSFAPHTPPAQRSISTFSSPGSILGKEEDAVIIELTPRYLCAGLEGDSGPQCRISFNPQACRRVGDYRVWSPGFRRKRESPEKWGEGYELWRNNIDGLDLGLLSDVLERTVREVYNKHLLVDAGVGRLVLVLPSLVPHPVLETILSTLFERWKYATVALLPAPTMSVVSAGLRAGLVVDIGWEETVVTSIYEYREISCHRSTRALKMLTQNFGELLKKRRNSVSEASTLRFDLDLVETVLARALSTLVLPEELDGITDTSATSTLHTSLEGLALDDESDIEIDWPGESGSSVFKISKQELIATLFETYMDQPADIHLDDHETPLPHLMFEALLSLPTDVRGTCMSRTIFAGPGSTSALLRHAILQRVNSYIQENGWTRVKQWSHGNETRQVGEKRTALRRRGPTSLSQATRVPVITIVEEEEEEAEEEEEVVVPLQNQKGPEVPHHNDHATRFSSGSISQKPRNKSALPDAKHNIPLPAADKDYVEAQLQRRKANDTSQHVQGTTREVHSLGAWAGASLLTSLKIRGFVEVDRERFLSHRLTGASREVDISAASHQRMSSIGVPTATKMSDRNSWTLGLWA